MPGEVELFRSEVPPIFLQRLLRAVMTGCNAAYNDAARFDRLSLRDVIPALRRAQVENNMRHLVFDRHVLEMSAQDTPSSTYTLWETPRVSLTAVTRNKKVDWVKPEIYRATLARSGQLWLPSYEDNEPDPDAKLYALLVYGGPLGLPWPTLCRITFPDPSGYLLPDEIDLVAEYPAIVAEFMPSVEKQKKPSVQLKKGRKAKPSEGEGA